MFHSIGIIICGKIYMWIFVLFVYFYSEILQISKVNYRTPFTDLKHRHIFVSVQRQDLYRHRLLLSLSFLYLEVWALTKVRFVLLQQLVTHKSSWSVTGNIFRSYLLFCILRVAIRKNPISVPLLCYLDFENFMSRHEYNSNTKILIICQSIAKQHSINQ